jgi:hypothetical protein
MMSFLLWRRRFNRTTRGCRHRNRGFVKSSGWHGPFDAIGLSGGNSEDIAIFWMVGCHAWLHGPHGLSINFGKALFVQDSLNIMLTMLTVRGLDLVDSVEPAGMALTVHDQTLAAAKNASVVSFEQFAESGLIRRL